MSQQYLNTDWQQGLNLYNIIKCSGVECLKNWRVYKTERSEMYLINIILLDEHVLDCDKIISSKNLQLHFPCLTCE